MSILKSKKNFQSVKNIDEFKKKWFSEKGSREIVTNVERTMSFFKRHQMSCISFLYKFIFYPSSIKITRE